MADVLIIVGSESDKPRIEPAFEILTKAGVTYEFHASSAHRQPEATGELVKTARAKGFKVVIAGAGLSAALPGFAASLTDLPVIGVPFAGRSVSEAAKPGNAAYLALRILGKKA